MTTRAAPGARRVLHVIHGLGSGVEQVVLDYVRATPEVEHHAVYSVDPACHAATWAVTGGFASAQEVPSSPVAFTRAVRRAHRDVEPHIVHAHSSVAGAVTRAVLPRAAVVYTPHCFAFIRRDKPAGQRAVFWLVEALLARRTRALAACSPHEAQLAGHFMRGARVHHVPNIAADDDVPPVEISAEAKVDDVFRIVTSGRISPQKDPGTFAELAVALRRQHPVGLDLVWVGSGSPEETERLQRAGVRVTGWVSHPEAMSELADSDLYVHTARWEAAPLTILEAARLGLPVLARGTAPIRALGLAGTWDTGDELLGRVEPLLRGDGLSALEDASRALLERHTPARQAAGLRACYADAGRLRRTPPRTIETRHTEVSA